MAFGINREVKPVQINEAERRRATDNVVNETGEILSLPEVQDSLERLAVGKLPNLLQRIYVPEVNSGHITSSEKGLVPIVSLYPGESLALNQTLISLGKEKAAGVTFSEPEIVVALDQTHIRDDSAPLTLIHELTHVHQQTNPIHEAPFRRYPYFGGAAEAEALNVEAVVARVLVSSKNTRWSDNTKLFSEISRQINKKPPVFPTR